MMVRFIELPLVLLNLGDEDNFGRWMDGSWLV